MSLGLLFTFLAIVIAGYGILDQVQKASLEMFFPWKILICAMAFSFLLSLVPYFEISYSWNIPLEYKTIFESWSFIILIGVLFLGVVRHRQARLDIKKKDKFANFLGVCLRENLFDEFDRIIKKNKDIIYQFSEDIIQGIYNQRFVRSLFQSNSWTPLELLTDDKLIKKVVSLKYKPIDTVIREMLKLEESPLQSAVVREFGGKEPYYISDREEKLIEDTFQNPDWYLNTRADYPLVMSAVEEIISGRLDEMYNGNGRLYESRQGISPRSRCIIFLSLKTHVMAIESAINKRKEGDFYISDLLDIFRNVLNHSRYNQQIWEDETVNSEHPTPFAFLIYEIANDFRSLSSKCIGAAFDSSNGSIESPGRIAKDLAAIWSFCIWEITRNKGNVSEQFRNSIIKQYLSFILQVGFEQSKVLSPIGTNIDLDEWRDLYANQLRKQLAFNSQDEAKIVLNKVVDNLDIAEQYVQQGRDWLKEQIGYTRL